jgi:membrane-associated phospholipid phosphatase
MKPKNAKHDITPYKGKTQYYVAALIIATTIFGVVAFFAHKGTYMSWEVSWFRVINDWPDKLRIPFLIATISPEALWIGAVAVVLAFLFRMYRLSWRLAVGIVGGSAVSFLAKHFIGHPRPFDMLANVHVRVHETGNGFPSGHTTMITIIMLMLLPYVPKKWRWVIPIPIIAVGLARVYLGVHTPLDIIGGFAVGLGVVAFLRILPQTLKVFFRLD